MMAARKKTAPNDEAVKLAIEAFAGALRDCDGAWRERWNRAPHVREMVHAFGVVLRASADDYVSDPVTAEKV
jgi:hypothetical protein